MKITSMNNFPDPKAVHFLHTSVVNRFIRLLAELRLGNEAGDHNLMTEEKDRIREEDLIINP